MYFNFRKILLEPVGNSMKWGHFCWKQDFSHFFLVPTKPLQKGAVSNKIGLFPTTFQRMLNVINTDYQCFKSKYNIKLNFVGLLERWNQKIKAPTKKMQTALKRT